MKKEINLELKTVHVEPKVIKTDIKVEIGEPIFDCDESVANNMGITREEYRRMMNSEEGYQELLNLMGEE